MAPLPPSCWTDPTIEAADRALEAHEARKPRRTYLGMSAIGHPCGRKLWYDLYLASAAPAWDAASIKRFADGHATENVLADRLRLVAGVTLLTIDPETGRQFEFSDFNGNFRGHMDGAILGLLQAPKTWHVWEAKCCGDKTWGELNKLRAFTPEKEILRKWNPVYYAQAVLYMSYSGMSRHYMTVSTPGGRNWVSIRTNEDPVHAEELKDKARRIIEARVPLARISNDPSWWQCRWCSYHNTCHGGAG